MVSIRLGFRVQGSGVGVPGSGFRVPGSGFGFRVSVSGFRVPSSGFRVSSFEFRVLGFGFRGPGFGFRVLGSGFRVPDFGIRVPDSGIRDPGFGIRDSGFGIRDSGSTSFAIASGGGQVLCGDRYLPTGEGRIRSTYERQRDPPREVRSYAGIGTYLRATPKERRARILRDAPGPGASASPEPTPEAAFAVLTISSISSSLLLSSLELSDTNVYEPQIRARLGTAAPFCEVVVLKLRNVPASGAVPSPEPSPEAAFAVLTISSIL